MVQPHMISHQPEHWFDWQKMFVPCLPQAYLCLVLNVYRCVTNGKLVLSSYRTKTGFHISYTGWSICARVFTFFYSLDLFCCLIIVKGGTICQGPHRGRGWGGLTPPLFCKNKNKLSKKWFNRNNGAKNTPPPYLLKNLLHGHCQLELRVFFSLEEQALAQKEYCLQE